MEALNIKLFLWLHQGAGHQPLQDKLAIFFATGGPYLLIFALACCWFTVREQRRLVLLAATETGLFALLLNQFAGLFFYYPRPFMVGLSTPLIKHAVENSFPSDHATLLLSIALYFLCRKGWRIFGLLLLGLAAGTGWGRVYAGVHFPFDMFGSIIIAVLANGIIYLQRHNLLSLNQWMMQEYTNRVQMFKHKTSKTKQL